MTGADPPATRKAFFICSSQFSVPSDGAGPCRPEIGVYPVCVTAEMSSATDLVADLSFLIILIAT